MSIEKTDVVWLKRWVISLIVMIPAIIINFLFFKGEKIVVALVFPDYLTVFGFCFLTVYGAWLVFSAWCIYQMGKPKIQKGEVKE